MGPELEADTFDDDADRDEDCSGDRRMKTRLKIDVAIVRLGVKPEQSVGDRTR